MAENPTSSVAPLPPERGSGVATEGPESHTLTDRARIAALGITLWSICCLVPLLTSSPRSLVLVLPASAPLLMLGAGVVLVGRHERWALGLLFTAFPVSIALVVAAIGDWTLGEPYPASMLLVAGLATLAFGAGTGSIAGRPSWSVSLTVRPLAASTPKRGALGARGRRRIVLGVGALGALLIAIIAPTAGGPIALRAAWGEAAPEAALLTAVVAGAVATVSVSAILGPVTRRRKQIHSARQRRTRVAMLLIVVVTGVIVWQLLQNASRG